MPVSGCSASSASTSSRSTCRWSRAARGHDQSLEVVRTLRDLADRWGALVVAEGIETPAQLEVVRSLGIGAGQGYLLGRPAENPPTTAIDLDELTAGRTG